MSGTREYEYQSPEVYAWIEGREHTVPCFLNHVERDAAIRQRCRVFEWFAIQKNKALRAWPEFGLVFPDGKINPNVGHDVVLAGIAKHATPTLTVRYRIVSIRLPK